MSARIRSLQNGLTPIDEASRDDLVVGDVVTVQSLDAATTYNWTLMYAPEGSAATFSGSATAVSPGTFTVDQVGPYLIRLIVDAGLPTEDSQYVRLRALTVGLGLSLVAAGERRDGTGIIPVDVDTVGWANEQNANLLALETQALYVDTLAETLVSGNVTGGTHIVVTTGDEVQGQTTLVLRADNNAADNIDMYPGASGAVIVNGKLTVTGLIDPTGIIFSEAPPPTTVANEGAVFVGDGTAGTIANHLYYRPASDGASTDISAGILPESLATTLGAGNTTGGNPIIVSTGDYIQGAGGAGSAVSLELRGGVPTGGVSDGGDVRLRPGTGLGGGVAGTVQIRSADNNWGVRLSVPAADTFQIDTLAGGGNLFKYDASTGKLTVPGLIDPTGLVFTGAAAPATGANEGAVFVSDGTGGLVAGELYFRSASNGTARNAARFRIPYHFPMPEVPADTVEYRGWVHEACTLVAVRVYMAVVNTQGNYSLTVTNNGTGNTVLSAASFDMNTLVADTVTTLGLTAVGADLTFAASGRWTVVLTSDDAEFDGSGIYIELVFEV